MAADLPAPSHLRYLSSDHLSMPLPSDHLDIRSREGGKIGDLKGVIIDPAGRQVLYLVVDCSGLFTHQRYLLPIHHTQIDAEHQALRVDVDSAGLARCAKFDPRVFPNFSDDDFIAALFPPSEEESGR